MSLIAWYPLNGNMKNYGVGDMNLSVSTTPDYAEGKIGQALSNGGTATWTAEQTASLLNNEELSICFWIKVLDLNKTDLLFGNTAMTAPNNRKFSIFQYPTANDLHLSWQNDASSTFVGSVITGAFPTGEWVHCAITYKNPIITVYLNGVQANTYSGVSDSASFAYSTTVIRSCSSRLMNDYRFYNHCLSPREVNEIAKGLLLHYPMNDNEAFLNENTLYDVSGYEHHGKLVSSARPTWNTDSPIGNGSYSFNESQYISSTNTFPLSSEGTVSFWLNTTSNSATQCLLNYRKAVGNGLAIFLINGKIRFDTNTSQHTFDYSYATNTWLHVVLTKDASSEKLYINGKLEETFSNTTTLFGNLGTSFSIGASSSDANSTPSANQLKGSLADYRIYATALSSSAIKELYQTKFSLANNGVLYCTEYIEDEDNTTKISFEKTGIVNSAALTDGATKMSIYAKSIILNDIIEN